MLNSNLNSGVLDGKEIGRLRKYRFLAFGSNKLPPLLILVPPPANKNELLIQKASLRSAWERTLSLLKLEPSRNVGLYYWYSKVKPGGGRPSHFWLGQL